MLLRTHHRMLSNAVQRDLTAHQVFRRSVAKENIENSKRCFSSLWHFTSHSFRDAQRCDRRESHAHTHIHWMLLSREENQTTYSNRQRSHVRWMKTRCVCRVGRGRRCVFSNSASLAECIHFHFTVLPSHFRLLHVYIVRWSFYRWPTHTSSIRSPAIRAAHSNTYTSVATNGM